MTYCNVIDLGIFKDLKKARYIFENFNAYVNCEKTGLVNSDPLEFGFEV